MTAGKAYQLTCCIDPGTGPWLLVEKVDGSICLYGSGTEDQAEKILLKPKE